MGDDITGALKVEKPTDAARLQESLLPDNAKIFIRMPKSINGIEHIFKTIRAAFLRFQYGAEPKNTVQYFNI